MNRRRISFAAAALTATLSATLLAARPALAQRSASVGTGLHTSSSSYFEQVGTNFGFSLPSQVPSGGGSAVVGLNAQGLPGANVGFNGVGAPAVPILGNQQGGATFGYALQTPLGNFFFGLSASEGANSSLSSGAASLTLPNGGSGFIGAGSLQPFVTGEVPLVGDFSGFAQPPGSALDERLQRILAGEIPRMGPDLNPPAVHPATDRSAVLQFAPSGAGGCFVQYANGDQFSRQLTAAGASSAGQSSASIAEIRAAQKMADEAIEQSFRQKMQWGDEALAAGKPDVARVYYGQVARRASGALKQQRSTR